MAVDSRGWRYATWRTRTSLLIVSVVNVVLEVLVDAALAPILPALHDVILIRLIAPALLRLVAALVHTAATLVPGAPHAWVLVGVVVRIVVRVKGAVAIVHGIVVHASSLLVELFRSPAGALCPASALRGALSAGEGMQHLCRPHGEDQERRSGPKQVVVPEGAAFRRGHIPR